MGWYPTIKGLVEIGSASGLASHSIPGVAQADAWFSALCPFFLLLTLLLGVAGILYCRNQSLERKAAADGRALEDQAHRQEIAIKDLQRSETERARLTRAVEASPESIVITDAQGTIEYVNPAFEKITGYRPAEAKGKNPRILKSGEHDDEFYADMWRTISSGKTWKRHLVNRHKSGRLFNEEATISAIHDGDGKVCGYVAIKRDVTQELKRAHMQQQSQKMESIGRLAGGMAHDFNNMLQFILGNVELAIESAGENELLVEDLEQARKAAKQAADLTGNLLALASRESVSPEVINLDDMVRNSIDMLRHLLHEGIILDWKPGGHENRIKMDPTQLNQILINLCLNASDAIEARGRITIATGRRRLTEQDLFMMQNPTPGDYVALTITDDGCGMDERTRDQAFEPFFTTKPKGKGTGLGLSTVYGIVKQNDGYIDCRSAPGQGTRFDLYFPLCGKLPLTGTESGTQAPPEGHGEGILVVEDETSILRLAERILKKNGYKVWLTHSPREAVEWVARHGDRIDLLLTDVVMPEMDGKELAGKISERKPGIRCVFMSGYPEDVISRNGIIQADTTFLAKPFDAGQLLAVVRNALAKPQPPNPKPKTLAPVFSPTRKPR